MFTRRQPMTFLSQEVVFRWLPVNLRTQLAKQNRCLRKIEKEQPYKFYEVRFTTVRSPDNSRPIDFDASMWFDGFEVKFSKRGFGMVNMTMSIDGKVFYDNSTSRLFYSVIPVVAGAFLGKPGTTIDSLEFTCFDWWTPCLFSRVLARRTLQIHRCRCDLKSRTRGLIYNVSFIDATLSTVDGEQEFQIERFQQFVTSIGSTRKKVGSEMRWLCRNRAFSRYVFYLILDQYEKKPRRGSRVKLIQTLQRRTDPLRYFFELEHADLIVTHVDEDGKNMLIFKVIEKGSALPGSAYNL